MNWNLFYLINKEYLDILALGLFYLITLGGAILSFKLFIDDIREDPGLD